MITRIIFKIEPITEQILKHQLQVQIDAENRQLDELMRQLESDGDPRTQNYLTLLRSLRDDFWSLTNRPGIQQRSEIVREKVGDVFDAAVGQLKETLRLARLAESLSGEPRKKVTGERETSMAEISHTIDQLRATIDQFREIAPDQARANLKSMREELEASIRVAKRTEQRMREMERLDSSPLPSSQYQRSESELPEGESSQTNPESQSQSKISSQPSSFIRE